jgi:hypothetical protein
MKIRYWLPDQYINIPSNVIKACECEDDKMQTIKEYVMDALADNENVEFDEEIPECDD